MAQVSDRDRNLARELPEKFLSESGSAIDRVTELVSQSWMSYDADVRDELVEVLVPVLEPLLESGAVASYRERDLCEGIVASWLTRQPSVNR